MILQLIALGFMVGDFVYHRWFEDKPVEKIKPQEVSIPRVDEGSTIPLIFGRCRVRAPILAWTDQPQRALSSGINFYKMDSFFVLGITMADGLSDSRILGMWAGDKKFSPWGTNPLKETDILTEISPSSSSDNTDTVAIGSHATFYDGNASQDVGAGLAGTIMINRGVDVFQIPSYFGYLSVMLWNTGSIDQQWSLGTSPSLAAYSFEASSYKSDGGYPAVGIYAIVGQDSNPVNVIYDLLVAQFGKLGVPSSYIDMPSFQAAATKCYTEGNGYSRAIENTAPAADHIQEILLQIDGALDEDPSTGKLVLTLIRNDYDPATIPSITKDNCDKLTNFSIGGWTGLPSSVRVIYSNRAKDYNDDSEVSFNQGNAANQGETEEAAIHMPGVCTRLLAVNMAAREGAARARPVIKCRVLVGREFLRVVRGQAVKLTWTNPDIAGLVFRVADVDRGTIEDGKVSLDLISDYFYNFRGQVPQPPQKIVTGPDLGITMG